MEVENKLKIWRKIFNLLRSVKKEEQVKIINDILLNKRINNQVIYLLLKNEPQLFSQLPLMKQKNILLNNNISLSTLKLFFTDEMLFKMIDFIVEKFTKYNIFRPSKYVISDKLIKYYLKNKMEKNTHISLKFFIYSLKNYQFSKEEIEFFFKSVTLKYKLENEDKRLYENFSIRHKMEGFDINKQKRFFILFLKQKKINDSLKSKISNFFFFLLKNLVDHSIDNRNNLKILEKMLYFYKYLEEDEISNRIIINYVTERMDIVSESQYLEIFNIKKMERIFKDSAYLNREFQIRNDLEYFLELNIENFRYKDELTIDPYLEVLETFIYDSNVDKTIITLKIIVDLITRIEGFDRRGFFKNSLKSSFFFDNQDIVKIDFRAIFIEIFNSLDLDLDYDDDEEERLIINLKYLYESIYYKDINPNNLKYILKDIKEDELINFLIYNNLINKFFSSIEIKNYDFEFLKKVFVKYIDFINSDIGLTINEKNKKKKIVLSNFLKNKYLDKNYHYKLYVLYFKDLFLKKSLLSNSNLSLIVLFKASSVLDDLKFIINCDILIDF